MNASGPSLALLAGTGQRRIYASRPSTVLVHVGASSDGEALVRQAAEVANLFGAKLIGVSTPPVHAPSRMSAIEEDATQRILENAGCCFATWSASVRAGACWTASDGPPAAALARLAWAADLIVANMRESIGDEDRASRLKSLVVRSRRPILVRPLRTRSAHFKRILVRWDGSAAGRRALSSALPFLARADSVYIAPDRRAHAPGFLRALPGLQQGLALRGIEVRTPAERDLGQDPAEAQVFANEAVDLVVMSAWPKPSWPFLSHSTDLRLQKIESYVLLSS